MIMPNNLERGFQLHQKEYESKAVEVLRSGWYILGKEVEEFEREWAEYCGAKYCVGLASGLDALWLAFRILGIGCGDEVIVPGNTYIASVMGVTINGATPIFLEPDEYYSMDVDILESKITENTKAVLVVHLYGIPSEMDKIVDICRRHNIYLIEDCAQSHGALYRGKMTGTFGDGGAIITNNKQIAQNMRIYRNYGSEKRYYNKVIGANSRLDEMQAGLLRVKLKYLEELIQEREEIASQYLKEIKNKKVLLPKPRLGSGNRNVWHQFVIRCEKRDKFIKHLEQRGVGTLIHYPIPPHLSEAYAYLRYKKGDLPITERYADTVCSIPIYNGMTRDEQMLIIDAINSF